MAKTPKLKKKAAQQSSLPPSKSRSRAARRAAAHDPTLNIDKSLLSLPPPSILSAHPGNGVVKNTGTATTAKERRKESRKQRFRRERGLKRAEIVKGKEERKVERSEGQGVVGRERGVPWDELNEKIGEQGKTMMTTSLSLPSSLSSTKEKKRRKKELNEKKTKGEGATDMEVDEDIDGNGHSKSHVGFDHEKDDEDDEDEDATNAAEENFLRFEEEGVVEEGDEARNRKGRKQKPQKQIQKQTQKEKEGNEVEIEDEDEVDEIL